MSEYTTYAVHHISIHSGNLTMPSFLQPDLLAGRSELPAGRVVRASARADLGGTLARAGRDGPAEAGAEEGAGVRRVDGGRPGVRADLQVRAELKEVRRRRG
jgi:hypothetical protein